MSTSSAAPVSIASGTSAGAAGGSVINVSSLVSELVAATRAKYREAHEKLTGRALD